jgi:hypothetical protein
MQTVLIRIEPFRSQPIDAGVALTSQEARQGVISGRVLLVLIFSLMLLAVAAGAILAAVHIFAV